MVLKYLLNKHRFPRSGINKILASVVERHPRLGFDLKKIVFTMIAARFVRPDGIPIGFEIYPGNTFEGTTVADIVTKMREKFKVRRFIFVGDRGLFSRKNLDAIRGEEREKNGEFIVGMKLWHFQESTG